jgi:hypothetical protein
MAVLKANFLTCLLSSHVHMKVYRSNLNDSNSMHHFSSGTRILYLHCHSAVDQWMRSNLMFMSMLVVHHMAINFLSTRLLDDARLQ